MASFVGYESVLSPELPEGSQGVIAVSQNLGKPFLTQLRRLEREETQGRL